MDILFQRLANHHLVNKKFDKVTDVVSHLGAVQAQDFAAAKWSIRLRMQSGSDSDIEKVFNEGSIIRTHVLRPTWHFVLPENLRWMLKLTSPRIKTFMNHYNKKLELTDELFAKANTIIANALQGNNYLTRNELAIELDKHKIQARLQRLGHILHKCRA